MTGGRAVKLAAGHSAPAPSQPRHRSHPNRSRSEPQALDVVKRDGTQATKTVQQTAVCDHRQGRSRSGKFVCSFHFACTMRFCDGSNLAIFASCDPTFTRRCRRRAALAPPLCRLCAAVELSRMHQCTLGAFFAARVYLTAPLPAVGRGSGAGASKWTLRSASRPTNQPACTLRYPGCVPTTKNRMLPARGYDA